ncbi:MAG TPA: inorganic phosphate transporter [Desulfobacteraceae bacterium]|jgi:inorganic phosphate transporter, PiT family|nr:inorganic phosphate transporter [Desulfobacteraceae bacterium]
MWTISSGLFLGWSLGANDSANVFGTGVATGIVRYRTAIVLTSIFVMLGAVLEGAKCIDTLTDLYRLIPLEAFICALAAAVTMTVLTFLAVPSSTSQAVVGAIIGAGILSGSSDFSSLYKIVACWVFTPVAALVLGYLFHRVLGFVIEHTISDITHRNIFNSLGILIAGCYGAYCLGSNNVANVTGMYVGAGLISPLTAAVIGGVSISFGVLTYSKKVMMTVGKGIVPLDPFSAVAAVLAQAATLHLFTQIGVPVSSSQAIVGAVVGVGLVADAQTISMRMLLRISIGWLATPTAAGFFAFVPLWLISLL